MEMNEKAVRLQVMLNEALQPMLEKIESLELVVKTLTKSQDELKKLLAEKE